MSDILSSFAKTGPINDEWNTPTSAVFVPVKHVLILQNVFVSDKSMVMCHDVCR